MVYLPDNPVVWALLFVTGAVIGSFLNVVIYRWPRQESIVAPPSHCMSCGARLGIIDLFPILSYVLLRGRCRHCGHSYSPRYAFVELLTGLLLVGSAWAFGGSVYALLVFIVSCCLLVIFFIDLDHMIIPDELVIAIMLIGVCVNAYNLLWHGAGGLQPGEPAQGWPVTHALAYTQEIAGANKTAFLPASLVGICLGGGVFMFVSWVFERVYGKPVLGYGDVKLAGAMGALFGPGWLFAAWFVVSVVVGAVVAIFLMVFGFRRRGEYIPFGPMLALGGIVLLLFPEVGLWVVSRYGG